MFVDAEQRYASASFGSGNKVGTVRVNFSSEHNQAEREMIVDRLELFAQGANLRLEDMAAAEAHPVLAEG
jgi:hypothetical protein